MTIHIHNEMNIQCLGPNIGFEFGWQYECMKFLEHHKHQRILQTNMSFVFCFMFSLEQICFALKRELCF